MVSLRHAQVDRAPAEPDSFGRRLTLTYAVALAVIGLMAVAGYLAIDGANRVATTSANAIALLENQRMLSQRVASLSAQYALGNTGVRSDLTAAIDELEHTQAHLVAGDTHAGIGSAISDPQLKAIYFSGAAPLDSAATQFVTLARRVLRISPDDRTLGAQTEQLFLIAQRPLLDQLDSAIRVRQARATQRLELLASAGTVICCVLLAALLGVALGLFRPMAQRIVKLMRDAEVAAAQATIDPDTGMLNRRSFHARGAIEVQKARRYGRPLSVLLIDADTLPVIEDMYGPDGGATVLRALTSSVFAGTRVCDLVARIDAEQFAILLPETNRDGAQLLAERLRQKISDLAVPIDNTAVTCTVSIGVASADREESFLWPTFKRADEALYEAKMRGRNRVVVAV